MANASEQNDAGTSDSGGQGVGGNRGAGGAQKDVSLGPACLIVVIICAIGLSLGMIAMAAMMSGSQGRRAAYSVREQIIPWVEQSSLQPTDRRAIVGRLTELSEDMEREQLSSRQLSRLVLRLSESPILQWGVVEQVLAAAKESSGLTAEEKAEFEAECDRWLLGASQGKLSLQEMEFALQNLVTKDRLTGRLKIRDDVSDERLREALRRITTISDKLELPKEPFHKSPSQVMLQVIEEGLAEKD